MKIKIFFIGIVFSVFSLCLLYESYMKNCVLDNCAKMTIKTNKTHENISIISTKMNLKFNKFSIFGYENFKNMLIMQAEKNTIILTFVYMGFLEMALNLYFSSIKQLHPNNYIFVSSNQEVTDVLILNGIKTVTLWNDSNCSTPSDYNTIEFGKKAIRKIVISLIALKLGYNVLFMDADIVLLKNPMPYISQLCLNCHIIFQAEKPKGHINTGFYFAHPTMKLKTLLHKVIDRPNFWRYEEQTCLSKIADELKVPKLLLPYQLFQSGLVYFDIGQRMFAFDKPCETCVIIHNNWILSFSNKRYCFKEQLMWYVEVDGYYSNSNAKYIIYDNFKDFGDRRTQDMEKTALTTAFLIGSLLDRVVILPKFSCYGCKSQQCKKMKQKFARCSAYIQYNIKKWMNFLLLNTGNMCF